MISMSKWGRWRLFIWGSSALLLGMLTALLILQRSASQGLVSAGKDGAASLPVLYSGPSFSLIDQDERVVSDQQLRGRLVVANFIYTHCTDICPLLTVQMKELQQQLQNENMLGDQVQLVSFSVDPARDTPAVLRDYTDRFEVDTRNWHFLTGPEATVRPLIVEGFRLGVTALHTSESPGNAHGGEDDEHHPAYDVTHSGRFVLIDQDWRIRAYYDGRDFDADRIVQDVRRLLEGQD